MAVVRLTGFVGEWPARDLRALPDNAARIAVNIRPEGGAYLKGLRAPVEIKDLGSLTLMVYRLPANAGEAFDSPTAFWMQFQDAATNVVPGPIVNDEYDRVYWGSPTQGLRFRPKADIIADAAVYDDDFGASIKGYALGVPRPPAGINVSASNTPTDDDSLFQRRVYVQTFVNEFGEEGPPGEPSTEHGYDDEPWNIGNFDLPPAAVPGEPAQADIEKFRLYRTVTGFDGVTDFYLVTEQDISVLPGAPYVYVDTKKDAAIAGGTILESTSWLSPPSECQGLASMPNGIFVSWHKSTLYFSENYRPHAWPPQYQITVDDPIVGLGVFGNACVVCTQGAPAVVNGIKSDALALVKIDKPLPCLSRRSIVPVPNGVYYASYEGLAFVGAEGAAIVSEAIYTRPQWDALIPRNFRATAVQSALLISNGRAVDRQVMLYPLGQEASKGVIIGTMPGTVGAIDAVGTDRWSGRSWYIRGTRLYEWDPTDSPTVLAYEWGSKEFQTPYPVNFAAFQVYFDDDPTNAIGVLIQALLRGEDGTVAWSNAFNASLSRSGQEVRMASGFRSDVWRLTLSGDTNIQSFLMATSVRELRSA